MFWNTRNQDWLAFLLMVFHASMLLIESGVLFSVILPDAIAAASSDGISLATAYPAWLGHWAAVVASIPAFFHSARKYSEAWNRWKRSLRTRSRRATKPEQPGRKAEERQGA